MRAAVFYGKEDIKFEERPMPKAGPGQMVVKIDYCGICGSDVEKYYAGTDQVQIPEGGIVPGHENVGTVVELGEGVTEFTIGQKVLCGPPTRCSEECTPCLEGKTNICIHGFERTNGIGGPDGGFAEYMLRDVKHTMNIPVPDGADLKDAVLFDIFCVGFHAIRRAGVKLGDSAVVSGSGPVGLAVIALLRAAGCKTIIALARSGEKVPILKEYGADHVININKTENLEKEVCRILGRDVGADFAFECAGNNRSLINCVNYCTRPDGQVIMIGSYSDPLAVVEDTFLIKEINLITSFIYTEDEVRSYLQMIAEGKIYIGNMVTDIIPLEDCLERGIAREDRSGQLKILIDPSMKNEEKI